MQIKTHCQYNESVHRKEQPELIRYRKTYIKNVEFIHVYFCEATDSVQYRQPNTYQEVLNTNHFGSVSDSLGRLASQWMASLHTITTKDITVQYTRDIHARPPDVTERSHASTLDLPVESPGIRRQSRPPSMRFPWSLQGNEGLLGRKFGGLVSRFAFANGLSL